MKDCTESGMIMPSADDLFGPDINTEHNSLIWVHVGSYTPLLALDSEVTKIQNECGFIFFPDT